MDSKPLWSDGKVRTKAEEWELLMVGHANMPAADYIEGAMIEVRDSYEARIAELEAQGAGMPQDKLETLRYAIGYQLDMQITIDKGSSNWINKLREAKTWLYEQRPIAPSGREVDRE